MVIILQQTTDNGKRFVSTVVEDSSSSFNSNFSLTSSSHNSISERSVIYKQRIDSLFGRHTRLNPFKPTLEPFSIRIPEGSHDHGNFRGETSSVSPSTLAQHQYQHQNLQLEQLSPSCNSIPTTTTAATTTKVSSSSCVSVTSRVKSKSNLHSSSKLGEKNKFGIGKRLILARHSDDDEVEADEEEEEDEDDDYERIEEKVSSIVTDSLNNNNIFRNGNLKKCSSSASHHVSSILLNCEDDDDVILNPIAVMAGDNNNNNHNVSASVNLGNNKTVGDTHMWQNGTYGESPCNLDDRQYGIVRSTGGTLKYSVDYLGSIPVDGTTTTLQDLQNPLKELYMNFLTRKNIMSGQLSITSEGLRFEAPKIRLVNPFTTIAVWAAIKFVAHGEKSNSSIINCAFMPLISDPEGQDKSRLFGRMSVELVRAYRAAASMTTNRAFRNPPIFACVMRESFSLDCHAFVCKCAEDAIVVAANLYQSLVDKMRTGNNKEGESGYGSLTRNSPMTQSQSSPHEHRSSSSASSCHGSSPQHRHDGSGSGSGSGGCCGGNSSSGDCLDRDNQDPLVKIGMMTKRTDQRVVFSDSESVAPIRPPRRKKKSASSSSEGHLSSSGNLKRYNSDDSILLKMPHRRKSIKTSGGHGYNQQQSHLQYSKPKKRVQISTPEETTSSDSVNESIDQILDRIINPGGMSFNDLKPSYQELILKIALTLTQDQLYQKSKQAMKKHQQFHFRKKNNGKGQHHEGSDDNSQFLNLLLKSFSKITSPSTKVNNSNHNKRSKTSSVPSKLKSKGPPKVILKKTNKESEDPFMSYCSGCNCEQCSEKCYCSLPTKHNVKIIGLPPSTPSSTTTATTTNPPTSATTISSAAATNISSSSPTNNHNGKNNKQEALQQCGIRKNDEDINNAKPRRKTCGYDTDSCEAIEKCYCSLQRVKSNGLKIYNINLDTETSDTDTNSYDFENGDDNFQGMNTVSTRSVEILSYNPARRLSYNLAPPPPSQLLQTTNALVHFEDKSPTSHSSHCNNGLNNNNNSNNNNGHGKGSVGLRNHSGGSSSSSYLHSSPDDMSPNSMHQRSKVLLITGSSNPSARVVYKDNYHHGGRIVDFTGDGKKCRADQHRNLVDIEEDHEENRHERRESCSDKKVSGLPPEKILSMKKTAELAAMFSDLKFGSDLDQTTDAVSFESDNFIDSTPTTTTEESNASLDFEASLGYLP